MDTPSQQNLNQLPIGAVLGDFKITGIVGEGGFGIVYLAYEAALDRTVAIKEYLPSSIAGRTGNQSVMVRSQVNSNAFASGLKNFLREAQLLARFSHPAMVEVHRVWEQNSTAYMAMRFYDGKTLRELRQSLTTFDELYIRRLMEPIFDALTLLHAQNVIHRDVSPDNILMRGSGAPVLLDLGAARLVVGGMTQALTTILKPGYAPIEQYVDDGTMRQGAWTDVYGLGAVLYFLLTGGAPPQAVARMITDPIRKTLDATIKISVAPYFIDAVVKALAVRPDDRFQQVDELRDALRWNEPMAPEPRTSYLRLDAAAQAAAAAARAVSQPVAPSAKPLEVPAQGSIPAPIPAEKTAPTAIATELAAPASSAVVAETVPIAATTAVSKPQPELRVPPSEADSEATIIWTPPAIAVTPVVTPAAAATPVVAAAKAVVKKTTPAAPTVPSPAIAIAVTPGARYGEAPSSRGQTWIFAVLAALVAALAGYFMLNRTGKDAVVPVPPVTVTEPNAAAPVSVGTPTVAPPVPAVVPGAPVAPAATPSPPAKVAAKAEPEPAKVIPPPELKPKAAPPVEEDKAAVAAARRDAEEKAKAKADALALVAKAKADADERRARSKAEADERALAAARADADEKARRLRAEEDERQASVRAKQEADRVAKAATATAPAAAPSGIVVAPVRRTVNELAAIGNAAFGRGEVGAARAAWLELVGHPEAQARSKAITYNNLAVSYCQSGDETNCERMYSLMFRADRAFSAEVSEREMPLYKRSYDRAARASRGQ